MEKHNRKSHLAPQLSPNAQALLRGDSSKSPSLDSSASSKTPTSGEIPISQDVKQTARAEHSAPRIAQNESNGSGRYSAQSSGPERPFPPRTSSNSLITSGRSKEPSGFNAANAAHVRSPGYNPNIPPSRGSRESDGVGSATNLPIRPAPPPSGPLPQPPGASSKHPNSRRPAPNGQPVPQ